MYFRYLFIILLTTVVVASCDSLSSNNSNGDSTTGETAPADTNPKPKPVKTPAGQIVKPQEFKLGKEELVVDLAEGMQIEHLGTFILICSSEVVRDARCFQLEKYSGEKTFTSWQTANLGNGRTMYYQINELTETDDAVNGKELTGYFEMEGQWYLVTCADTSIDGEPDPLWCLPYLASLRKGDLS